jgi:hypothetical protein
MAALLKLLKASRVYNCSLFSEPLHVPAMGPRGLGSAAHPVHLLGYLNCSTSVDPSMAMVEASPPVTIAVTASK